MPRPRLLAVLAAVAPACRGGSAPPHVTCGPDAAPRARAPVAAAPPPPPRRRIWDDPDCGCSLPPPSRTARLAITARLPLAPDAALVAIDGDQPVLDDGAQVWREIGGALVPVAPGDGAPGAIVWAAPSGVAGLARGGARAVRVPDTAGAQAAVIAGDALYWIGGDPPVVHQRTLATGATRAIGEAGHDWEGALSSDGHDIFVGYRDGIWRWDGARRHQVTEDIYWPGALAAGTRGLLADVHGKDLQVRDRRGVLRALLSDRGEPIDSFAWLGDGVIAGQEDTLLCWRAAIDRSVEDDPPMGAEHLLYETPAAGIAICALAAAGTTAAWIEAPEDDWGECTPEGRVLVTARLDGRCE